MPASVPPVARGRAEGVDLTAGVAPDLRTRGFEVRVAIRVFVELIGPDGVGSLRSQAPGDLFDIGSGLLLGHGRHLAQLRPPTPR